MNKLPEPVKGYDGKYHLRHKLGKDVAGGSFAAYQEQAFADANGVLVVSLEESARELILKAGLIPFAPTPPPPAPPVEKVVESPPEIPAPASHVEPGREKEVGRGGKVVPEEKDEQEDAGSSRTRTGKHAPTGKGKKR